MSLGLEVGLGLDQQIVAVHLLQVLGFDDHRAEHARGNVTGHRVGAAVVEPDPGHLGGEPVHQ